MYNTIIVPTDFSHEESTIEALKKAKVLADNGSIVLMHVLERVPAYAQIKVPTEMIKNLVPKTRDALKELQHFSGVEAKIEVRQGNSYRQIIKSAQEHNADLIIINSHQPGLKDYLLGSTAAKVVRHSPCAVLVVR